MSWIKKGNIFNWHHAQLPVVESREGGYKIYYSTRDEQNRSYPRYIILDKEFKLWDSGEINIPLGKPGSFDSHGVMPTDIITLEDGTKYLYYVGWSKRIDIPYWNSLGLAISKDGGVNWEKYSEAPILSTNLTDPGFMGTCCVDKIDGCNWVMYYSSAHWEEIDGQQECIYDIKKAVSSNGTNWRSVKGTEIPLKNDEGGIAAMGFYNGKAIYSVRKKKDYRTNSKNSYRIKSYDLYYKDTINELLPEDDELMCAYPFVIEEEDKYVMFYNTDFGKSGISYAIKMK